MYTASGGALCWLDWHTIPEPIQLYMCCSGTYAKEDEDSDVPYSS